MVKSVEAAVDEYEATLREWVGLQSRFTTPGVIPSQGTTKANRLARRMGVLADSLLEEPAFRDRLDVLLSDTEPHVRSLAAMYALNWDPSRAERVLVEIEAQPGLAALGAHYILKRHREGPSAGDAAASRVPQETPPDIPPDLERLLDDVWQFHGATMNGGFLLAFETAGHLADRVREAFDSMDLPEVAETIAAASRLFPGARVPEDESTRSRLIGADVVADALEALGAVYTRLVPDDEYLESRLGLLTESRGR